MACSADACIHYSLSNSPCPLGSAHSPPKGAYLLPFPWSQRIAALKVYTARYICGSIQRHNLQTFHINRGDAAAERVPGIRHVLLFARSLQFRIHVNFVIVTRSLGMTSRPKLRGPKKAAAFSFCPFQVAPVARRASEFRAYYGRLSED